MKAVGTNQSSELANDLENVAEILRKKAVNFNPRKVSALQTVLSEFIHSYQEDLRDFDPECVARLQNIYKQVCDGTLSYEQSWSQIRNTFPLYLIAAEDQLKNLVLTKEEISKGRAEWDEFSFYGPKVAAAIAIGSLFEISGRAMLKRIQGAEPFSNEVKDYEYGYEIMNFKTPESANLQV
ncbi:MAG: hypothetical protein JNM39_16295 [Bdellovibrionaceae bacterium]|nr:hypothetical protein [Pseudobdellovibrionaceae bacterium]